MKDPYEEYERAGVMPGNLERPITPCWACGYSGWWWRDPKWGEGEWVCGKCHPKPTEGVIDNAKSKYSKFYYLVNSTGLCLLHVVEKLSTN